MENSFEYKPRNCWEIYDSEEQREQIHKFASAYLTFLNKCKNERETVQEVVEMSEENGFVHNFASSRFYSTVKDKTILLVRKGKQSLENGFRLLGAHADSPRLDFKQHPLYESCDLSLAKTHYYGGIRKHQWFSRPLALHGVVIKSDGSSLKINIGEDSQEPVFVIADLLPHLAYKQNEQKLAQAFEAEKMNVLLGSRPKPDSGNGESENEEKDDQDKIKEKFKANILYLLNQKYGIIEEDLFSAEIQAVPAGPARSVGLDESLIGGYGQDDRICVFCGFKALMQESDPELTQVVVFWDKEEIGSEGATSARSLFLEYTLNDLFKSWEPKANLSKIFAASKAISADVHGSLDPDYQDLHDQLNASKLGYGPVFCKFTGHRGKVGANDASAEYVGWFRRLLNKAEIPWQMAELGKVDTGGGGTVAKHLAVYGMDIIDFGPGVLGMHSPFEISSKADLYATYLAYREFLKGKV